MNKNRPVNLDLRTLTFPPMAIVSILHRISGIVVFLLLPAMLYFLGLSLRNQASFLALKDLLAQPAYQLIIWAFLSALVYHLLAGIRHMVMDMGYGEHVQSGRRSAIGLIGVSVITTLLLGIWIW